MLLNKAYSIVEHN